MTLHGGTPAVISALTYDRLGRGRRSCSLGAQRRGGPSETPCPGHRRGRRRSWWRRSMNLFGRARPVAAANRTRTSLDDGQVDLGVRLDEVQDPRCVVGVEQGVTEVEQDCLVVHPGSFADDTGRHRPAADLEPVTQQSPKSGRGRSGAPDAQAASASASARIRTPWRCRCRRWRWGQRRRRCRCTWSTGRRLSSCRE